MLNHKTREKSPAIGTTVLQIEQNGKSVASKRRVATEHVQQELMSSKVQVHRRTCHNAFGCENAEILLLVTDAKS